MVLEAMQAGRPLPDQGGGEASQLLERLGQFFLLRLVLIHSKHESAVEGEGLEDDVKALAVLMDERDADVEPDGCLPVSLEDGVRAVLRLLSPVPRSGRNGSGQAPQHRRSI
jgi:hypothetical protein